MVLTSESSKVTSQLQRMDNLDTTNHEGKGHPVLFPEELVILVHRDKIVNNEALTISPCLNMAMGVYIRSKWTVTLNGALVMGAQAADGVTIAY